MYCSPDTALFDVTFLWTNRMVIIMLLLLLLFWSKSLVPWPWILKMTVFLWWHGSVVNAAPSNRCTITSVRLSSPAAGVDDDGTRTCAGVAEYLSCVRVTDGHLRHDTEVFIRVVEQLSFSVQRQAKQPRILTEIRTVDTHNRHHSTARRNLQKFAGNLWSRLTNFKTSECVGMFNLTD